MELMLLGYKIMVNYIGMFICNLLMLKMKTLKD